MLGTISMKSRSKRNRKRRRGGIGCLVGDGGSDEVDGVKAASSLLRTEVVPLSRAYDIISGVITNVKKQNEDESVADDAHDKHADGNRASHQMHDRRRVRIVHPYPFTFATFAKARWIGRTVVDIYHEEFGEKSEFDIICNDHLACLHLYTKTLLTSCITR